MVARDTYRWALIKHATTNPAFVAVAFPMPYSKYVLRNDKGPERNLKSYRSKAPLSITTTTTTPPTTSPTTTSSPQSSPPSPSSPPAPSQKPSPLKKEVIYTAAELEPPAPIVVKPTKTARTVRWVVDDEPYEAAPPPPPPPPQQRRKGGRREQHHQAQTPCRSQYTPVRGVSMWFTAV